MINRKFLAASAVVTLLSGAAYAAVSYVPYQVLIPFTGNDLVMMGPKSSSQAYSFDGDFLAGHLPLRNAGPTLPAAPTLTCNGTGTSTVTGADGHGTITTGTGVTFCNVKFNTAYKTAPDCGVWWQTNIASMVYTVSDPGIGITQTSETGNKINYVCMAPAGG